MKTKRAGGIIVFQIQKGKARYLLLKSSQRDEWGFPKGHLEKGEDFKTGALRELQEETGLEKVHFLEFQESIRYSVQGNPKEVFYFLGKVRQNPKISLSQEHQDYIWAESEEVKKRIFHSNLRNLFGMADNKVNEKYGKK